MCDGRYDLACNLVVRLVGTSDVKRSHIKFSRSGPPSPVLPENMGTIFCHSGIVCPWRWISSLTSRLEVSQSKVHTTCSTNTLVNCYFPDIKKIKQPSNIVTWGEIMI